MSDQPDFVRRRAEDLIREQRDLSVKLNSAGSLMEGLQYCYDSAIRASEMDGGGIYLFDRTSGDLELVYHKGLPPEFVENVSRYEADSDNVRVIQAGNPIYTQHQQLGIPLTEQERKASLKAVAVIPFSYSHRVIGCLNIASYTFEEAPAYSRTALESIAAQIGGAIARLEMAEALQASHETLEKEVKRRTADLVEANQHLTKEIEERKQATRALRDSEEIFSKAFHSNAALMAISTLDNGRYIQVNEQFLKIIGVTREEVIGKTSQELDIFVDYRQRDEIKAKVKEAGFARNAVIEIRSKNGDIRHGIFSIDVIQLQNRPCLLTVMNDITELKQAENDLKKLQRLLANIVNSMPSILVGVNLEGDITLWNLEAERTTGISVSAAQGEKLSDVYPQLSMAMDKVKKAIRTGKTLTDEKVVFQQGSSDDKRFVDVTVYPLAANGLEGAVIRVDDVTERVRMEEMMIQSEKMLSVGGLAAGIAHEINNPLAGILQNSQVLKNRLSGDLSKNRKAADEAGITLEAIQAYMERRGLVPIIDGITESSRRAAQLVNNMLSFSRKSESKLAPCDLSDLLDRTVDIAANDYDLKKNYDFRRILIVRDYQEDMPDVLCEETKIQQVFLNLMKNAAQAMTEIGVQQDAPSITLRLHRIGLRARIEVEDNGPGLEESAHRQIFEPFYTTKASSVGTGLGLSISNFIVTEHHHGTLRVKSPPGKGATFIIELPIRQGE
ncbi:MAG: PAS domain S-box protein [Proteobacteria bacterium]|nr:PAS domain S-box protein [Pseudomonadota bacterium]